MFLSLSEVTTVGSIRNMKRLARVAYLKDGVELCEGWWECYGPLI
jgi:hypothetical protein